MSAAGRNLEGCILYTTTFPCLTCAQKMLVSGIRSIVYVESYPDLESVSLFETVEDSPQRVKLRKFEGIKARAYHRSFGTWRKAMEDRTIKKKTITTT